VIGSVQAVVDRNAANWRDRGILVDDLRRLREFRAWHDNGYRGYSPDAPGYRR
jgi:hypothetical protein